MIIAQITDLHIGFDGKEEKCKNTKRFKKVLAELNTQTQQPDLMLITGDLVESGEDWAYEKLKKTLDKIKIPYYLALGNHDNREKFIGTFSDTNFSNGFLQYTIEDWPLRIIVLDTLEVGKHGGGFCDARAEWLHRTLSEQADRPTLIALHHPPIRTGIAWMTIKEDDIWVERLKETLNPFNNIVHIISGHIHRNIFSRVAGTTLSVSLAVAPQVKLDLGDIDPDRPDNRILLTDAPSGYSLHYWDGAHMTSHSGRAPDGNPVIHYDEKHSFVVRHTMDLPPKKKA